VPGHTESILIDRALGDVFAYMNDVSREHEWQPQLRDAEQIPAGPTRVGTRRRYESEFLGKRLKNTYIVRVYEPEVRVVLESTSDSAVQARTEILWQTSGDATRVTMSMEGTPSGVLRFVPRAVLESAFAKEIRDALRRLKQRLESADGLRT
jgi:uncharacterized membrane protein